MITEKSIVDSIHVLSDGQIQVRRADIVYRDGIEIARTLHRHVIHPGAQFEKQDSRVRAIAMAVHTPAVIAAYQVAIAS